MFPDFDYAQGHRPAIATLSEFIARAQSLAPHQSPIPEQILSYDSSLRNSKSDYHEVILAYLRDLNPEHSEIVIEPLPESDAFSLTSATALTLISSEEGSRHCVLRFLNLRSLVLQCPQAFNLNQLEGLAIKELDLTQCVNYQLNQPLHLPVITTIKVAPGQSRKSSAIECRGQEATVSSRSSASLRESSSKVFSTKSFSKTGENLRR